MNVGLFSGIIAGASGLAGTGLQQQTFVVTQSNSAFPIPSFAQGGKGVVIVNGCGGGGSGARGASADPGGGGAGGAIAHNVVMMIPRNVSTLNIAIGSGGAAQSTTGSLGNAGGTTSLVIPNGGGIYLLGGGAGPVSTGQTAIGGYGYYAGPNSGTLTSNGTVGLGGSAQSPYHIASGMYLGSFGGAPGSMNPGENAGGSGPFGIGGGPLTGSGVGIAGQGYGSGGSGSSNTGGGASGAGAPGLLILTFVEALV